MQLVAPGQDQLRTYVLNVGRLEVIQFHRAVRTIVDTQRVMRCQLHLFKLQVYRFIDPINKLIDTSIDRRQNGRLLVYLELELGQKVLVQRVLRRLHLVE